MNKLAHITLDTGHVAMIPPDHLTDQSRQWVALVLARIKAGQAAAIPNLPGWRVDAQSYTGQQLSGLVEFDHADRGWVPIAWLGVAASEESGEELWAIMHKDAQLKTDPDQQPELPWLATRLIGGVVFLPEDQKDIAWLADFGECLAWAWLQEPVILWNPRHDEYAMAAGMGWVPEDQPAHEKTIHRAQEIHGEALTVRRWHIWRIVRAMVRCGATPGPNGMKKALLWMETRRPGPGSPGPGSRRPGSPTTLENHDDE